MHLKFPHSSFSWNWTGRRMVQLPRVQILEQHLSNSSSLSCHFAHSLQTPKGLLSISWRKILQPFPVAYFSSSLSPLIFSFSALYYVDSLGLSSRKKSTYSLEERRKKIRLAISKFTLAGWGIAQVRVHSRVNSFWFLYTRYSLNVMLIYFCLRLFFLSMFWDKNYYGRLGPWFHVIFCTLLDRYRKLLDTDWDGCP